MTRESRRMNAMQFIGSAHRGTVPLCDRLARRGFAPPPRTKETKEKSHCVNSAHTAFSEALGLEDLRSLTY